MHQRFKVSKLIQTDLSHNEPQDYHSNKTLTAFYFTEARTGIYLNTFNIIETDSFQSCHEELMPLACNQNTVLSCAFGFF